MSVLDDWEIFPGYGYETVVVGYAEEGIEGEPTPSNADGVSKAGIGCVAGTCEVWTGGVISTEAIGVRYWREDSEDCGRLS